MRFIHKAIAFGTLLAMTPLPALAQYSVPGVGDSAEPLTLSKTVGLVQYAINTLLGLALTVVIAMIVYNGFRMATSRGNETVYKEGKKGLWYAIIGLTVIFSVGLIIATIGSFAENPSSIVR